MSRKSVVICIICTWLLFIGSIIGGYNIPTTQKGPSSSILNVQPGTQVFWHILLANLQAGGGMGIENMLTLGLFGSFNLVINGIVVGQIIHVRLPYLGMKAILLALIPHGLFEISSFGLFLSIGAWWSYRCFLHWFFRLPWPSQEMRTRSLYQLVLAIGLMTFAALIESFVTPFLFTHL
jgi:stage II sporulation protein M